VDFAFLAKGADDPDDPDAGLPDEKLSTGLVQEAATPAPGNVLQA